MQRQISLLFLLAAPVAAQHGVVSRSPSWSLVLCALCLTAARWLAHEAKIQLVERLVQSARAYGGMSEARAQAYARAVLAQQLLHRAHRTRVFSRKAMNTTQIIITNLDRDRLGRVLESAGGRDDAAVERLDDELERAEVVSASAAPDDLVTMNSRVRFLDEVAGTTREITIVYPADADAEQARISVLSPVGSALLGLRVGQAIEWPLVSGRRGRYRVLALPYQPEAFGHYHL